VATIISAKTSGIKRSPKRRGVNTGLLRFLMGGTCDGEGKPTTVGS
jgi:hypothetical protein